MIDSFFTIGHSHHVCQDYVFHNNDYVILSDGCSGVADSDFGSRILAKSAEIIMKSGISIEEEDFGKKVISKATAIANEMSLPSHSLAATLLIAVRHENSIKTYLAGDGVIAARNKAGYIVYHVFNSDYSAPFYLEYLTNPSSKIEYIDKFGKVINQKDYLLLPDNVTKMLGKTYMPCDMPIHMEFSDSEFDLVAIMSDGFLSFLEDIKTETSKTTKPVDLSLILRELFDFKNYTKGFLKRRCQIAFRKFAEKQWKNYDDFSIGIIKNREAAE